MKLLAAIDTDQIEQTSMVNFSTESIVSGEL